MVNLPVRYPFRPPMSLMLIGPLGMGLGVIFVALSARPLCGWIIIALFILLSVLAVVHQIVCQRYLELGADAILIPSGFLHRRFVRIPYEMIDLVRSDERFLHLRAESPQADIASMFLRRRDFVEIKEFLLSHAAKNMELRRQHIRDHPELDRRPVDLKHEKTFAERFGLTVQLPDREAFLAYWNYEETFHWRQLARIGLYLGGLGGFAVLTRWSDPAGRFWILECMIAVA